MKKHAATIVLVLLAVALGVWLWVDRDRVTEGERKRRENNVFVAWRRDELSRITIVHDGETIVLERERAADKPQAEGKDGLWRMISPRAERADPVAVGRLLTTLEFATVARKVDDGIAQAAQGLDAPRATGTVQMGGLAVTFALGGPSPRPEGSTYFRVGAEPAVVVSKEIEAALLAPSDTYRDRTVVPYLAAELARVEVKHESGGFVIERIDERSFRVTETGMLASRQAIDRIWAALAEMRAEAFAKDADVERLTAHPTATVFLTPKDSTKPPAELVVGEACPGYPADVIVLRKTPTRVAACAPKDVGRLLAATAASLVERHPFPLHMDEIEELRLERSNVNPIVEAADAGATPSAVEIARKGPGFRARAPFERDLSSAEAEAATELVTRIASLEATTVTRGGGGAFPFVARAKVRFGEHEQIVEIGPHGPGGRATVRRVLDDARLEMDPLAVRWLLPRETSLRPRSMLDGEKRRPMRVLLRCGTDQELVDRGEGFRLVAPAGYETDGTISQLVDGVLRGRVEGWVADTDDGSFGFTRDGCRVIIAFEDGNAPVTLLFSEDRHGVVYARIDPRPGVFLASHALRELAGAIYVSHGTLHTDASRIERVRATFEGKPVLPRSPTAFRDAVAALYADSVLALRKKPDGAPDLVIEISLAEGGPPRRIACRPAPAKERRVCTVEGVDATFAVAQAKLAAFQPVADAGPPDAAASTP